MNSQEINDEPFLVENASIQNQQNDINLQLPNENIPLAQAPLAPADVIKNLFSKE